MFGDFPDRLTKGKEAAKDVNLFGCPCFAMVWAADQFHGILPTAGNGSAL